ncbi:hypothetical protein BH18ACI4_BH18ACI4_22750 [soil metagenome]
MKVFAELERGQISTAVGAAPLPDEDPDYHPRSLGRPSRGRLHAVSPLQVHPQSGSLEMDKVELSRVTFNSQSVISGASNLVLCRASDKNAEEKRLTSPMLTTEEFIQVRLATVRESARHCYWPADVLARFAAADVIH